MRKKCALLTTAVLFTAPAAFAQEASPPPAAGDKAAPAGIADIVVTAQKRSESLSKTAAAVTAVSADTLVTRGVVAISDAQMVVPAARFANEGNNTQVFLRGVGSALDYQNTDPAIAFNFNGVYMPREATTSAFFDLAAVEVLPGPQGTLYGRGAIGGIINVKFQRPDFNNDGNALLEAGNYELIHGTVAQNFAFSDDFAIRLAGDYIHHDGYFTSGAAAPDDIAGRLSALYKPNDSFSAYLWATAAKKNGKFPNLVNHSPDGFLTSNPYDDVGASAVTKAIRDQLAAGGITLPFDLGTPEAEDSAYNMWAAGGEIELGIADGISLTYLPGYTRLKSKPFYWIGSLLFQNVADIESTSHELRLSGDSGSINWLAGAIYYHQSNSGITDNFFAGRDNPFIQHSADIRHSTLDGVGVFGEATVDLSDSFRVTLGGRYGRDKRKANGFDPGIRPQGVPASTPWSFEKSYDYVDWKAGLEYDLTPRVMAYANIQTAHAPGTYNPISPAGLVAGGYDGTISVNKSKLTAYVAGLKSRILNNSLQVNIEGYYYDYKDLTQVQFDASTPYNPIFNAKKLEVYGFQADLVWQPTTADSFNGSASYTHARNKDFMTPAGADYSGLQPPYAPEWTLLGSYTHTFELPRGFIDATVSGRYESSWWSDYGHSPGTQQKAHAKLDASLAYDSDKGWKVALWGKNLTDKTVLAATASAGFPGPATGYLEAPRTYGVRLTLDY